MSNMVKLGVLAGILMLSISADAAISLGSASGVSYLNLEPGAYGVFSASFFSMGDEPIDVKFEVEYPSDLRIDIAPDKLTLGGGVTENPDSSGSWLILDGGRRYVKTYPVRVYVKIPSAISRNVYKIKLTAKATGQGSSDGSGFRQSLVQVREVILTAHVPGSVSGGGNVEIIRKDASYPDGVKEELEEGSYTGYQPGTSAQASAQGSSQGSLPVSSGSAKDDVNGGDASRTSGDNTGGGSVTDRASGGNTEINLPTGKISLNKEQTKTAMDLGLITLIISVASLIVRILK